MVYVTLDLKNKPGSLREGVDKNPDAVILIKDEDLVDLANGTLNVQTAIQRKKMNIKGKMNAMVHFTNAILGAKPKL